MSVCVDKTYDTDFYKWTQKQSKLLKDMEFDKLDLKNLIEEIADLGSSKESQLESHLIILLMHLLKQEYQQHMRSHSWIYSIRNSRFRVKKVLSKNPSLKHKLPEIFKDAYFSARLEAIAETGEDEKIFPKKCPWTFDEIMKEK